MSGTENSGSDRFPETVNLYDRLYDRVVEATILGEMGDSYRVRFSGAENADTEFEAGTGTTYISKSKLQDRRREVADRA